MREITGIMFLVMVLSVVAINVNADEMVHKFKSPSFSGVGTSSH